MTLSPWTTMKRITALGLLVILAAATLFFTQCTYSGAAWLASLNGDTPEGTISAYVHALSRGDQGTALAVWNLPAAYLNRDSARRPSSAVPFPSPVAANDVDAGWRSVVDGFAARRLGLTHQLATAGIRDQVEYQEKHWWTLCCDPREIDR